MTALESLTRHPLAGAFTEAQISRIDSCARAARFTAGAVIFREGEPAESLYLIVRGRIVLEQHVPGGGSVQLETLTDGDVLGLSWLFQGGRWVLDARAAEETETVALDAKCLHSAMEQDPALGFAFTKYIIEQLYQRLERVRLQRLDVYRTSS